MNELTRERLYETTKLEKGAHPAGTAACLMEMTALLAGEKHTDHPVCACPVITAFAMRLNDGLPNDLRQMLKPYAPAFIGTRDGYEEERREYLVMRAITVFAPYWLRLTGKSKLIEHARLCEQAKNAVEARARIAKASAPASAAYVAAIAAIAATATTATAAAAAYAAAYAAASAACATTATAAAAAYAAASAATTAASATADATAPASAAAYAAASAACATYCRKHLPTLMPAILETLDGLLLIGAERRDVRQKGVIVSEQKETAVV